MTAPSPVDLLADLRRLNLLTDEAARRLGPALEWCASSPGLLAPVLREAGLTKFQAHAAVIGQADRLLFGPYVLLDKIGDGGMGVVYKARHARLGRIDAVKVLRADKVGSRSVARRFLREIELTSCLEHPHIVYAHDAGIVGGRLYLATEYVDGTDLEDVVRRKGPLSVADACLAMYQTAQALRHVHEKGLVHRDLKPSNLLREHATGAVKLLDLGMSGFNRVAAIARHGATLTRDGVLLGTPDFMAPEQAEDARGVDIRADLYSLGCTFYYLLTGRVPFDGSQVQKLFQHASSPPPPLVLPNRSTPPALAAVVARLLAKQPRDRFQSPGGLIDALLALRPGARRPAPTLGDTPPPAGGLTPIPAEEEPEPDADPVGPKPAGGPRWWLAVAALALLFGAGFLTAAIVFATPR